jgi:cation:H+ antiporter
VGSVSTALLVVIFVAGSGATWAAGVLLSKTTDSLDRRLGLGDEVGGLILLAIAGTLPEIAIVSSAALAGHLDLAVGNLIGGIAIQTLVLVALDASTGLNRPLSFLVGSLIPVLEALIVIVCLATVLGGAALPASTSLGGVSPSSIVVVVLWLGGLWVVNRTRKHPEWKVEAPGSSPGRRSKREDHPKERRPFVKRSTAYVATAFGLAAIVTLAAGVTLQSSGNVLADRMGLQGAVFGATILALATALPELSSGIEAVQLGDHQLAVGDILGGNSFQLTLFVLADILAGTPVIVAARGSDVWLGAAGVLMTGIVAAAVIARPQKTFLRLGVDSWVLLVVYAGTVALLGKVT